MASERQRLLAGKMNTASHDSASASADASAADSTSGNTPPKLWPEWLDLARPHFVKPHLVDELSFSLYFHSTTMNQLLHLGTFLPILVCTELLLESIPWKPLGTRVPLLSLILIVPYSAFLACWDLVVGGAFMVFTCGCGVLIGYLYDHGQYPELVGNGWWCLKVGGVYAALALCQLGGHVAFEFRLPAFRAFEAVFSTPFLLMLLLLNWVTGYASPVVQEIRARSVQWKTYKQRVFFADKKVVG